ncbi:MAG: TIGR02391 family protein [Dongiaceae bacterium]
MDRSRLRGAYGRLVGLRASIPSPRPFGPAILGRDFDAIVITVCEATETDLRDFQLPGEAYGRFSSGEIHCNNDIVRSRVHQLISYLELVHHVGQQVVEIGSIYNSIQDAELKERCSDLLSAPGNFDRVINQATQVLEDRIRTKAEADRSLTGTQLVNAVMKTDVNATVLKLSDNADEHEGICHVCRGVMLAFRNPTHHTITDQFSREDALKVCAFIDNLLRLVDRAEVRKP